MKIMLKTICVLALVSSEVTGLKLKDTDDFDEESQMEAILQAA